MRTTAEPMFRSTLTRRRHRAAAGALAVALGAALIGAFAVLWAQAPRDTAAAARVEAPVLGTPSPAPTVPLAAPNPTPNAAPTVAPTVVPPTVAAQPSPPQPNPAQLVETVNRLQAEAPITFQAAGTRLTPGGEQSVQRLIGPLRDAPGTRLRVVGHSAVVRGDPGTALRVSQQRAEVVAAALRAGGIGAERLEVVGAGDTQALSNPAASRRVVISVI